jgi:preprotein translocase subunit SecF
MLELVPPGLHIDFVSKMKICLIISLLVILIGVSSIVLRGGLNEGLDFSGGTLLQLRFSAAVELGSIREALGTLGLERGIVQHYGSENEIIVRIAQMPDAEQDLGTRVQRALQERFPQQTVELRRAEIVGAQVSIELRQKALLALFYAILGTLVYLSGRFEAKWFVALGLAATLFAVLYSITQWLPGISPAILIVVAIIVSTIFSIILQLRYALAAIIAIYHDVLITVGFLSLFNKEFDLQIIAALLTIIGYSLNDTIVIFDRIRENLQSQRYADLATVVNASVNQTLSRTLLTTGHTLLVVLAIFFLGGEVLHDFAFALLVGMIAGTYSTVFIASPILVYWQSLESALRGRKVQARGARPTAR